MTSIVHGSRGSLRTGLVLLLFGVLLLAALGQSAAFAGPLPGWWYGLDSEYPATFPDQGGRAPHDMPDVGGRVGFYNSEVDTLATVLPCWDLRHTDYQFNAATYYAARDNYRAGYGLGAGEYHLTGGPGADPGYDGTIAQGYRWGQAQAARAYSDWQGRASRDGSGSLPFRILWMDIEPQANGVSTGWRSFVNACGDVTSGTVSFPTGLSRAVFNGFWDYLNSRCCLYPGSIRRGASGRRCSGLAPTAPFPARTSGPTVAVAATSSLAPGRPLSRTGAGTRSAPSTAITPPSSSAASTSRARR